MQLMFMLGKSEKALVSKYAWQILHGVQADEFLIELGSDQDDHKSVISKWSYFDYGIPFGSFSYSLSLGNVT